MRPRSNALPAPQEQTAEAELWKTAFEEAQATGLQWQHYAEKLQEQVTWLEAELNRVNPGGPHTDMGRGLQNMDGDGGCGRVADIERACQESLHPAHQVIWQTFNIASVFSQPRFERRSFS